MPDTLEERLKRRISDEGPIPLADYVAAANAHYYGTRDPLGTAGDFTTAPEISQMFGELVGLWLADLWQRAGRPASVHYVELGPGRGTLAADALRAMASIGLAPQVHLVETSPALRRAQAERVPGPRWHEGLESLPETGALLIVANEFFDALPARQFVKRAGLWRERLVDRQSGRFVLVEGGDAQGDFPPAEDGAVFERSEASETIVRELAGRLKRQGGAALIVDYGHVRTMTGDTFQAVSRHAYADPLEAPGERDLTFHVDFAALGEAARAAGAQVRGPAEQGAWLEAMGINVRAAALARAAPERAEEIAAARDRLVRPEAMGRLFKAMALIGSGWPEPEGF